MSTRPTATRPTATGVAPKEDRLKGVLAAGLAQLSLQKKASAVGMDGSGPAAPPQSGSLVPPPAALRLDELDQDTLKIILSYTEGMPCEAIAVLCTVSTAFNVLCQDELFWKWQSQIRNFTDVGVHVENVQLVVNGVPQFAADGTPLLELEANGETRIVPKRDGLGEVRTWKNHYKYFCLPPLTNQQLRRAVRTVMTDPRRGPLYKHPVYGPIANWNVSQVTDMSWLFMNWVSFNAPLSSWDVSRVTNMSSMFENATSFNGDLRGWDVSGVTDMSAMFANAESFNNNLRDWDVSDVRFMQSMFRGATAFEGVGMEEWRLRTANVVNMSSMFKDATSFNRVHLDWATLNVRSMYSMFERATSFDGQLPGWNVTKVETMEGMFRLATSFRGRGLMFWEPRALRNLDLMFEGATNFNEDISGWRETLFTGRIDEPKNVFLGSGYSYARPYSTNAEIQQQLFDQANSSNDEEEEPYAFAIEDADYY